MDFEDTPDESAFRAQARAWLGSHAPHDDMKWNRAAAASSVLQQDEAERAEIERARAWQHELFNGGWAGITWPTEYGGRGGTPLEAVIFAEEQASFEVPTTTVFLISIGMVGPTLIAHGTEEQKVRHLGPILRGDEVWCQLFSEPNAGSDLAGLLTRADRVEGGWLVNGQKVWTTGARVAQYGALMARTDPSLPKHRGLSYLILDMSAPGIEIRPLRQINGDAHFNEVYLNDVYVPLDAVVGDVNDGWRVANTMLLNERGNFARIEANDSLRVMDIARLRRRSNDPVVRQGLATVYSYEQVIRLLALQARTSLSKGTSAPWIASITKLLTGRKNQLVTRLALDLLGPEGMLTGRDAFQCGEWQYRFFSAPVTRIAGGTDEIQKNILAERLLGLPREPRSDREVAFDQPSSA
jgi:alkylation response protein AidB-like acyl-CoA dehydrogenase